MSDANEEPRLKHFPVPIFAMVMGSMGASLALLASGGVSQSLVMLGVWAMWFAVALFGFLGVTYVVKCMRFPEAVRAEWNHPVRLAFFPAISISFLLMASALLSAGFTEAARGAWILGAGLQGVLTIAVISRWISHRSFEVGHLTPAWFIPAVGNVIAPIAGAQLGYVELSWLFFSAGLLFWLVLLTLVFNRLIFHNPLPDRLYPTLVILIAPPSVGYLGYVSLTGEVDGVARLLLNAGYIFAALTVVQMPKMAKLPFSLSWWALSFPVAALTSASFSFAGSTGSGAHTTIGAVLLAVTVVVMAGLFYRTALAALRGQICVPE